MYQLVVYSSDVGIVIVLTFRGSVLLTGDPEYDSTLVVLLTTLLVKKLESVMSKSGPGVGGLKAQLGALTDHEKLGDEGTFC